VTGEEVGQMLRVYEQDSRIEEIVIREEEVLLQLVGWEWDPRRLEIGTQCMKP
jgi:hypothetical protein